MTSQSSQTDTPHHRWLSLADLVALRLRQIDPAGGDARAFAADAGVSWGTYYALTRAQGNPTLRTMEKIAAHLGTDLLGLLGFTAEDQRRAFARVGIDYDTLVAAVGDKSLALEKIDSSANLQR